jgi:hypothetical protein
MKFFLAVYSQDPALIEEGASALTRAFEGGILGEPDIQSRDFPITETDYYAPEMGANLLKRYLTFPNHLTPDALVDLKLCAMALEKERSVMGRRRINLDPGYIFSGGLVLSTGKFSGHRLYLGKGVWGELTLLYRSKSFVALPWSYQDYLAPELQPVLHLMRESYLLTERLRQQKALAHADARLS